MSKKATKALNNPYYIARYNASKNNPNLTSREKTAEIYPEEVLAMADVYEIPELCNMYCSGECAIGRETVKPINADSLDRLILQFLGSSQKMENITEQLINITSDGIVDEGELEQFDSVLSELEKMSVNIQSLMMWAKKNKDSIMSKRGN